MEAAEPHWVRWPSHFRGQRKMGQWHARFGLKFGPKATVCGLTIPVGWSVAMEQPKKNGENRKDIKPKSNVCKRCEKALAKGHKQ